MQKGPGGFVWNSDEDFLTPTIPHDWPPTTGIPRPAGHVQDQAEPVNEMEDFLKPTNSDARILEERDRGVETLPSLKGSSASPQ